MFLVKYSHNRSCILKKDCSCDIRFAECWYRTQSQKRKIIMFVLYSLFYIFWYLVLRILEILIPLVMYGNQQSSNLFLWYDLQAVRQRGVLEPFLMGNCTPSVCHDIWLICTVNTSYLLVLAMYKKILTYITEISNQWNYFDI